MSSVVENTLPEEWKLVKFDDLFKITSSKRVHKKDWVSEGVPFYRAREIVKISNNGFVDNELFITKKMFDEFNEKHGSPEEDDILVTGVGTLGVCYIVKPNDKFYFKDGNIIWFKKKVEVESRYIEYGFQSDYIRNQVYSGGGSTVATYTIIRAKNTTIPLPPLEEQKRIVAKIDGLFAKIDKAISLTEESLKQANNLLPSVLKEVFEKFELEIKQQKLKDVCELITDGAHYSPKTVDEGYPYVTVRDVSWNGDIDLIGCANISEEDFQDLKRGNCSPMNGDILYSKDGTVGKIALVNEEKEFVVLSSLAIIRPTSMINPKFLMYSMMSPKFYDFALSSKTGAAIKRIVLKTIKEFEVSIPDLGSQLSSIKFLDKVVYFSKENQSKLEQQLAYLKQLRSSILSKAFKGEL